MAVSKFVRFIAMLVFAIAFARTAAASDVTVAWDAPTDGITTGIILYYGTTSGSYTQQIDVGATTQYTVTGLVAGTTYYFAVRAYDASGNLSDYSAEVSSV